MLCKKTRQTYCPRHIKRQSLCTQAVFRFDTEAFIIIFGLPAIAL